MEPDGTGTVIDQDGDPDRSLWVEYGDGSREHFATAADPSASDGASDGEPRSGAEFIDGELYEY